MNFLHIKLSELSVSLFHAISGVDRDASVKLILHRLEKFCNMERDFWRRDSFDWEGFLFSIKCIFTMAPGNDGINVGRENWFDSCVSRLLADVHGHIAT